MTEQEKKEKTKAEEKSEKKPEPPKEVTISGKEYEELKVKVEELGQLKDKLMRSAADFDNAKKRLAKEREDFVKFSQERLISDLLPVIDHFELALGHADQAGEKALKGIVTGVQMVVKQLLDGLKAHGLTRIETVGKVYDPHLHESVGQVEEAGKEDEIVEEVQAGYKLNERVIRAAKVKVRVAPKET